MMTIVFGIFLSTKTYAQFRYKVESSITISPTGLGGGFQYTALDSENQLRTIISNGYASAQNPIPHTLIYNGVKEFQNKLANTIYFNYQIATCITCPLPTTTVPIAFDGCYFDSGTIYNNGTFEINKFNLIELSYLADLNPQFQNVLIEACEDISVQVANCQDLIEYEVQIISGSESYQLLPFAERNSEFSFSISQIPILSIGEIFRLQVNFVDNPTVSEESDELILQFIDCSPELIPNLTTITNETCFDSNDGSVTLTFNNDVDTTNGYEMRYFIYQGNPNDFDTNNLDNANPPQAYDELRLGSLTDNGDGTFSGASNTDLESGDYYIVYQEVLYNGLDVTVKSGEITPQFTIERPTEVIASGSITAPLTCGDTAKIAFNAIGGDNLDSSGNYAYQYSLNGGVWTTATQNPQPITLGPVAQNVAIKAIYSVGNCESTEVTLPDQIDPAPPELIITNTSFVSPSSTNAIDGSIRVQISGGTPSYTYVLSKLNTTTGLFDTNETINNSNMTTVDFFGKPIGTYRVMITDANTCSLSSGDIVVTAVPPPTLGAEQINQISCVAGSDGSIDVDVSGGVLNYNYQWTINGVISGIQTTGSQMISLSNLSEPGEYILKVGSNGFTDFNDASGYATNTINLIPPEEVIINSAIPNNISCNGAQDGSIAVTAQGGTSYQYKLGFFGAWTDLVGNTIPITSEEFYDVYLRNQNGCESAPITGIFVAEPEILEVTATSTDATTNGGSEGTITLTVTGGTTPYTNYTWQKDGLPFVPSVNSTDTNLVEVQAGTYQVTVTDTNTCTTTSANIIVTQPGPLGITSLTPTPVLCRGEATGGITAVVTGVAPFNYLWERQDGQPITSPNAPTIANLTAGTYILRLTDTSGDPEVTDTVTITEPLVDLAATTTSVQTSCYGENDGSITINALGGTAPYEYAIDDGFGFQAGNAFANLAARTYVVTVRDANNCEFNTTAIVDQPAEITLVTDELINASVSGGTDGAISITVNGGTAPYTYSWTGPNGYVNNGEDIAGLEAGSYTLVVRDANNGGFVDGCYFTQTFEIIEPGPLSITNITPTGVDCFGETTGSITTTVTGTGTITYLWTLADGSPIPISHGTDDPDISGIGAGNYRLTVTDDSTTTSSAPITVVQPTTALAIQDIFTTDVTCNGSDDGAIQVVATGGTAPYQYALNGGAFQNSDLFTGLSAIPHVVTVVDNNGCVYTNPTSVIINEPQELAFAIDLQQPLSAANATDGAISITASGGTGNLSYSWTGPSGFTSADEDISNLEGGDYILTITDENYTLNNGAGCILVSQPISITEPGELLVTIDQTVFLECYGDDFGEIMANVQGGVSPYTFEWFQIENANNILLTENTEIIGNLSAGTYFVRVTDANSITVEVNPITIIQPDVLGITINSITDVLCNGEETGGVDISVLGGTLPYTYDWSNGSVTEDLTNVGAGEYDVLIVDANGCFVEASVLIEMPTNPLQISNSTITDNSAYNAGDGSIAVAVTGGLSPYTIVWTRLSDSANVGDSVSITNLFADSYEVLVTDANGCSVTEIYEVTQPDIVDETIVQPTCSGESNGSISLIVNEGNGNFTYSWNTGETTSGISGLGAGSYSVTIEGFGNGPITRTYEILYPSLIDVDLGENRVLCLDQEAILDATVEDGTATYAWTSNNGFSSTEPLIMVTESGNYSVTVQTATGCTATGSVFVDISTEEISAEFAVSSQAFVDETIVAVDISYPLPDGIEWILPSGAEIRTQNGDEVEFFFAEAGEYEIGIVTTQGDCTAQSVKKVMVLEKDVLISDEDNENGRKQIENFIIYPNPTNGRFTANVSLTERADISIKVFSFANNALIAVERARSETSYSIPFDLSGLPTGVYAVLLETPYGNYLQKVIVN